MKRTKYGENHFESGYFVKNNKDEIIFWEID